MKRALWAVAMAAVAAATMWSLYATAPRGATLLLVNGRIYTLDPAGTVASAVALKRGRIAGVGSDDEMRERFPADSVVDLGGKTVLPGLIDGHGHVHGLGKLMESVLLYDIASPDSILRLVAEQASSVPAGQYILGRGWDQNLWPEKEFPTAAMLDRVAPGRPVILIRVDGHAVWVNTEAMRRAGVTAATPDPKGGKILRDRAGEPTGVFLDDARPLVEASVPPQTPADVRRNILTALRQCAALGLTEVHDMGVGPDEITVYRELARRGELPIRVYAAISAPGPAWDEWKTRPPLVGEGGGMFTLRAVKSYVDGALGSRGAALLEAYSDDPGNRGITITSETELAGTVREALRAGYQPSVHAIGDRANYIALNAFAKVQAEFPPGDYRARIEHAQVIAPGDIPRFHELHVLPSMEPVHATSDMYWAEARLGPERVRGAYAWGSLLRAGSIIIGGSDFPNDKLNPIFGFYAAVTRRDRNGYPEDGWLPQEKMSREEAARCYTSWAAFGAFQEGDKGTIEPGKWADLTILSKDIMTAAPAEILAAKATATVVAGKFVYSAADSAAAQ
jgi:predicted amidohydrolase YtcJ